MSGTRLRICVSLGLVALILSYIAVFEGQADTSGLSFAGIAAISSVLMLTIFLAALRLQFAAADLGHTLRYCDCLAATAAGNAAGYVVFQLVGQIAARRLVLGRLGVSVDTAALATMYERFVAVGVSLAMAMAGGLHLFGKFGFDLESGGQDLVRIAVSLLVVVSVACVTIWRRPILHHKLPRLNLRFAQSFARLTAVTALIQGCTLIAFVLATRQFAAQTPLEDSVAASAIVMFAAAIPISFAGWGMRELGAVAALGAIGVSAGSAMSASVLIGLLSLLTVGLVVALTLAFKFAPPTVGLTGPAPTIPALTSAMVWAPPLLTALLMFFQIRAPITGGFVTLSPADLFATVSGTTFFFNVATDLKLRKLLRPLFWFAGAGTLVFLLAYANGLLSFGSNQWATSKLFGWLLLLAYLATGATISLYVGAAGITATVLTMLTASATIIAMDAVTHYPSLASARWEGLAGNPNAFAFQVAVCFAAGFAIVRQLKTWPATAALLMTGVYFSLSRSGAITLIVVVAAALIFRTRHWKGLAVAAAIFAAIVLAWSFDIFKMWPFDLVRHWLLNHTSPPTFGLGLDLPVREGTGIAFSDSERWNILQNAWTIFTQHPLTGSGLGYYYAHFTRPDGSSVVIHSTPLWLLAEVGLFGTLVFVAFGTVALTVAVKRAWSGNDAALMFVLTAIVFCVMGAIQDMFYQRTMWFVAGLSLGALLIQSSARWRRHAGSPV